MFSDYEAVLYTLLAVAKSHGKPYCWPSQKHICILVNKFYKISISRRTLNRILRKLEDNGLIIRIRRFTKEGIAAGRFASTLYKFKGKAFNYLISLGNRIKGLFSFFRVPKWAQHRTPHSLGFGSSMGIGGNLGLLERGKVGPLPVRFTGKGR